MIYLYIFFYFIVSLVSINFRDGTVIAKSQKELSFAITLCSIVILAFLVGVNEERADFKQYLLFFFNSPDIFDPTFPSYALNQHTEIGYNYFQALCKFIFNSASFYFVIVCFVSLCFRYRFYKEFVSLSDLTIVFFAFLGHEFLRKDCVQVRNGFASAIVLFSFVFLYHRQKIRFIITVLLASTFHSVALVALPLIIVKIQFHRRTLLLLRFVFIICIFFSILLPIKNIFYILEESRLLPSSISNYLYWSAYSKSMPLLNPQLLRQVLITFFLLYKYNKYLLENKFFFLTQIYSISTFYYLLFRDFEILAGRFGSLFYAVEAPLLIMIVNTSKKNKVSKKISLYLFYFILFIFNYLTN